MINKVILLGNVGRDPEIRTLDSGAKVARVPVATNENYRDRNTGDWQTITTWHDVVMWRDMADRAERQLRKGSLIYVEGKITKRKYTDKDNIERYVTDVVANSFRSLDRRDSSDSNSSYLDNDSSSISSSASTSSTSGSTNSDFSDEAEDDLPF